MLLRWLPALIWMTVIFNLSSRTGSELQSWFPFFSNFNWGHFLAYFILSGCFLYALHPWRQRSPLPIGWIAILLSLLYGISDEWHQSFVPSRTPELGDLINDTLGAALAAWPYHYIEKRKGKEFSTRKSKPS